jgi:hypothetical protein
MAGETMFRHMAILKFKADAKPTDIAAYFEAFPSLMASRPVIKSWSIGRNRGAGGETHVRKHDFAPNYDVGLMMDFDSAADYLKYAESAEHQAFFAKYCVPILAERVVAQFPLD